MMIDPKKTLLIVDDEGSILDVSREFFEIKGYNVFTAGNGVEALTILGSEKVDCCFTDINMPEMDGLDLAERIRKKDNTIPVVIMTGFPSFENTLKTMKNGVVDFLIKPVDLGQMEICLERVLRERQLFVENLLLRKEIEGKHRLERLNRELVLRVEELNVFNRIMADFTTVTSSTDALNRTVDMAGEITRADASCFYVFNEDPDRAGSGELSLAKGDDAGRCVLEVAGSGPPGNPGFGRLLGGIAAANVPLLVRENPGGNGLPEGVRSFMGVPMIMREKVFGVLTASITQNGDRFTEKDLNYLSFVTRNAAQALENLALYEHIYENLLSTLYAFVKALEAKDAYTQQHSTRVTEIALAIGRGIGCTPEEMEVLNFAGRLHDIGKLGIPDNILLKPGKLTAAEFESVKRHPGIGADIVGQLGLWDQEQQLIRCHHERFDGTGYPQGLKGEEIPLLARVLSVADAYDAMASDRAYRHRLPAVAILKNLEKGAGSQWDGAIVGVFLHLHNQGHITG